jgi:hypothetical protein
MALRKHKNYRPEDVSVALTMMSVSGKRPADDTNVDVPPSKRIAMDIQASIDKLAWETIMDASSNDKANWVLKPAPYFYYTDRSREPDDDPFVALTPPGLVPTFPAKVCDGRTPILYYLPRSKVQSLMLYKQTDARHPIKQGIHQNH